MSMRQSGPKMSNKLAIIIKLLFCLFIFSPAIAEKNNESLMSTKDRIVDFFETFFPSHLNSVIENKELLFAMQQGEKVDKNKNLSLIKSKIRYLENKLNEKCQSNIVDYIEIGIVISEYLNITQSKYHSLIDCIDFKLISNIDTYYPELATAFVLDRGIDGFRTKYNHLLDLYFSKVKNYQDASLLVDLGLVMCDQELLKHLNKYKITKPKYFKDNVKGKVMTQACELIEKDPTYYIGLDK